MSKTVSEFIERQRLVSVQQGTTIAETLAEMGRGRVGTILVLKGASLKGVFSERDLIRRVYKNGVTPQSTPIDSVMTSKLSTARASYDSRRCLALLRMHRCRTLPVIEWWNKAIGVVSIIDVLMDLTSDLEAERKELLQTPNAQGLSHFAPYSNQNPLQELVRQQALKTLGPDNTVFDAVQLMADANIGSVLIMEGEQLKGIISERDVLFKVAAKGINPRDILLPNIMTTSVTTIDAATTTIECLTLMKRIGCRHLPVSENGKVVGVVSILNCLQWIFDEFQYYVERWRALTAAQGSPIV